jgi:hypothetical protein
MAVQEAVLSKVPLIFHQELRVKETMVVLETQPPLQVVVAVVLVEQVQPTVETTAVLAVQVSLFQSQVQQCFMAEAVAVADKILLEQVVQQEAVTLVLVGQVALGQMALQMSAEAVAAAPLETHITRALAVLAMLLLF